MEKYFFNFLSQPFLGVTTGLDITSEKSIQLYNTVRLLMNGRYLKRPSIGSRAVHENKMKPRGQKCVRITRHQRCCKINGKSWKINISFLRFTKNGCAAVLSLQKGWLSKAKPGARFCLRLSYFSSILLL